MGHSHSSPKREICSNTGLTLEKEKKSQVKNLTLYLKDLEKTQQTKPNVSRRENNNKDQCGNK